jgi:arylsulfatase K
MIVHQRPNIVFIHTDSLDGRIMGCMGHRAMVRATPNLDRLAAQGVLFRNAYCNSPVCCPSRSSMLSGLYTHHCEGWNNYKGLSDGDPTFLDQLQDNGYRLIILGKTDYLSGQHTIRARVSPWTRSASILRPNYRMGAPEVLGNEQQRVHSDDWEKVDSAVEWLHQGSGRDEPYFLYVGIGAPHPEFRTSQHYLNLIDQAGVSLPAADRSSHPVLEYQRTNKNWMHGFADETIRLVRRIYFAMIAEVDLMVGRLMEAIEHTKAAGSTYVIFSSDHGELAMEHRQFYKMSLFEPSVHVPLIIRGPGVRQGVAVDLPVSLVDIYPTLMYMASLPCPEGLDGQSLEPELTVSPTTHRTWALSEFHGSSCNTGSFMLREGSWKYIAYVGYPCQLFNLDDDPAEIHDLAETWPGTATALDQKLRGIVDCDSVDAKVKSYDRISFNRWREEHLASGDYQELMTRIFSGWDGLAEGEGEPWSETDERLIASWLHESGTES